MLFLINAMSVRGRLWTAYFLLLLVGWFAFCGAALATDKPHPKPPTIKPEPVVTDTWDGKDKRDHLVISAAIGAGTRAFITAQPVAAGGLCLLPGLAKELYDARKGAPGAFSEKDMLANLVGCGLGVLGSDLALTKDGKRYTLGWNVKF